MKKFTINTLLAESLIDDIGNHFCEIVENLIQLQECLPDQKSNIEILLKIINAYGSYPGDGLAQRIEQMKESLSYGTSTDDET